jgi:hypothetical protein
MKIIDNYKVIFSSNNPVNIFNGIVSILLMLIGIMLILSFFFNPDDPHNRVQHNTMEQVNEVK